MAFELAESSEHDYLYKWKTRKKIPVGDGMIKLQTYVKFRLRMEQHVSIT
jgi:hypothetical protein